MTTADTLELCECGCGKPVACRGLAIACYLRAKRAGKLQTLRPALRGKGVKVAKPKPKAKSMKCVIIGCRKDGEPIGSVQACADHTDQVRRYLEIPVSRRA